MLAGLIAPTSGEVHLDGQPVSCGSSERLRRRIGFLTETPGLWERLTVRQNMSVYARLHGLAPTDRVVDEALDTFGILDRARDLAALLSKGLKQRVALARTLLHKPPIVLLDEPTAGLDPEERLRFYRILTELAQDRIVLLSTHIVEDVNVLCPRFVVIRQGRLVAQTSPHEAQVAIRGKIFEGRVAREDLDEVRRRLRVTQAVLVEGRHRVRIYEPSGTAPVGFEPVPVTLEDAYLLLMQDVASAPEEEPAVAAGAGQ